MGVPGLTTFVDQNFHGWRRNKLNGHLVVDGYSLCHRLYVFEWSRGGQYPQYRVEVLEVFKSMFLSGIQPVVVFDGIDYKQEKVATTMRRRQESIKYIHSQTACKDPVCSELYGNVLPVLAIEVFQLALHELKVPVYVVDGEADSVIVEIANYLECPVLASDSDYFIYEIKGGYIPIDRFHWKSNPIEVEVFHLSVFTKQFGLQHQSLRFLIPAIVGNDFLTSISSERLPRYMAGAVRHNRSKRIPVALIMRYASQYNSMDNFIEQIEQLPDQQQLKDNCIMSVKMYSIEKCTDPDSLLSSTELCTLTGGSIPGWVMTQYRRGSLSQHCMNILVLGKLILRIVPDDSKRESSFTTSLSIREKSYRLLSVSAVTEYRRCGLDLNAQKVHPTHHLPPLNLGSIRHSSNSECIQYACAILECDHTVLSCLNEDWRLVAAIAKFWASKADVPSRLVQALLYCHIVCFTCKSDLNEIREKYVTTAKFDQSPKRVTAIHAFSQWQCCYFDGMCLNQLLMEPFKFVSPAFLYDGTIALYLAQNVETAHKTFAVDSKLYIQLADIVLGGRNVASDTSISDKCHSTSNTTVRHCKTNVGTQNTVDRSYKTPRNMMSQHT